MNFTKIEADFFTEISRIIKTKRISTIRQLYNLRQSPPKEYIEYVKLLDIHITGTASCKNDFKDKKMLEKIDDSAITYEAFESVFNDIFKAFKELTNLEFINSFYAKVESLWLPKIDDAIVDATVDPNECYKVNLSTMIFSFLFEYIYEILINKGVLGRCQRSNCNKIYSKKKNTQSFCSGKCRIENQSMRHYRGYITSFTFSQFGVNKSKDIVNKLTSHGYIKGGFLTDKFTSKRKNFVFETIEKSSFGYLKDKKNIVWDELVSREYINKNGVIQPKFNKKRENFIFSDNYTQVQKDKIFGILRQALDNGRGTSNKVFNVLTKIRNRTIAIREKNRKTIRIARKTGRYLRKPYKPPKRHISQ